MGPGTQPRKPPAGPPATPRGRPPVTPQRQVNSGQTQCPLQVENPCDVDKLVMKVVAKDKDPNTGATVPVTLVVSTSAMLRNNQVTDVKDRNALARLREYDLVIETIADCVDDKKATVNRATWYRGVEVDEDDVANIEVAGGFFHGRKCSRAEHAYMTMKPLTRAPEMGPGGVFFKTPGAEVLAFKNRKFYGPAFPLENLPSGNNVTALFELVASLFLCTRPKDVEVVAYSCGKRARGETKRPNVQLKGLVRIYRRDKWTVGIKIPPLGGYKASREASTFRNGIVGTPQGDYKRESSGHLGAIQGSSSTERAGKTTTQQDELWVGDVGRRETSMTHSQGQGRRSSESVQTSHATGQEGGKDVYGGTLTRNSQVQRKQQGAPKRSYESFKQQLSKPDGGFDVVLARNDREIVASELITFIKKLAAAIETFGNTVVAIQNFFKKLPQAGWKFTFEVSAFAGMVLVEWAPRQIKTAMAGNRYYPVEYKFKGRIQLEILNLSLSLSFGIEAKALDTGIVAKVSGTLKFKASIARDIDMGLLKPQQVFDVDSSGDVDLTAEASATVLGYTLADGRLSVSTGLELKGKVVLDWKNNRFDLRGTLKRKSILLTGSIQGPWWYGKKRIDPPVEILKGGDLHTFK